jgi:hypothetical protein
VKEVAIRPGKVREREDEVNTLRALIAKGRAERRRQERLEAQRIAEEEAQKAAAALAPKPETDADVNETAKPVDTEEKSEKDEKRDLMMLAAIAQNIFDDPPASDDGGDDGEAQSEPERPQSSRQFVFDGKALDLPSVADGDSRDYRIEALRKFIEEGIGLDKFLEVYEFIRDGTDALPDGEADMRMREILSTPKERAYYPLVQQLIVCEGG